MKHTDRAMLRHRIGFVSTRFSSTDGVSLETEKWAHVLKGFGQECFYFAGLCINVGTGVLTGLGPIPQALKTTSRRTPIKDKHNMRLPIITSPFGVRWFLVRRS
jgi:hypothetical protein